MMPFPHAFGLDAAGINPMAPHFLGMARIGGMMGNGLNPFGYNPYGRAFPRQPSGMIMPAPEDEPWRETLCVDKERIIHWGEAAICTVLVMFLLIFRGWLLLVACAGSLGIFGYCYVTWNAAIAKHQEKHQEWIEDKSNPFKPNSRGFYVIKNDR
jgi:hypothetical protein